MLENLKKGDIVIATPLREIEEFVHNGLPSEESLKILYDNNFVLTKIIDNKYYFANRNTLLDSPFIVKLK